MRVDMSEFSIGTLLKKDRLERLRKLATLPELTEESTDCPECGASVEWGNDPDIGDCIACDSCRALRFDEIVGVLFGVKNDADREFERQRHEASSPEAFVPKVEMDLPRALRSNRHLSVVLREISGLAEFRLNEKGSGTGNLANLRCAKGLAENALVRAGLATELPGVSLCAWDNWYKAIPVDLKRRLSFDDFKRLGEVFAVALAGSR